MYQTKKNEVVEIILHSERSYCDPFNEISVSASFTSPDGSIKKVLAFWAGSNLWHIRYSSNLVGTHRFTTACSDSGNSGLNGLTGEVEVTAYTGENPLYKHGAVQKNSGNKYLEHTDGTPFFWLGDTWWMAFTTRLSWPDGFKKLTADRVEKGFSVVQIIAGLYPDMKPFDERGTNEAGFPWDPEFKAVNPAYFDAADKKIQYLIDQGIVPCIVGCWGFFTGFAGIENIRRHWNYLLARWAAYPVVWCIAGEANMAFYDDPDLVSGKITYEQYIQKARKEWTELTRHVKKNDPFKRLITIHPTQNGHEQLEDETLLDLDMLQTGHAGPLSLLPTIKQVKAAVDRKKMPVIDAEVNYEGICGSSGPDIQRYCFWANVLTGCCGHTYGANGIWQLNTIGKPYGPSPHGATWGDTPWQEAYLLPGSWQVGESKKFLMQFPWHKFERHPEWVKKPCSYSDLDGVFCAGVPGEVRVVFCPFFGGDFWGENTITNIETNVRYKAKRYYPISGVTEDYGIITPKADGSWTPPRNRWFGDHVIVLQKSE
ncbi:MAG TPA: DUF4038 domain-containing protein [Oscillospiraceae bacterium]|nr:DUF4038 domain-containing protein [Oscillospiraceae bacterium]